MVEKIALNDRIDGISPSEQKGQYWLVDNTVITEMCSGVDNSSKIIEIGAGLGNMTRSLAERAGYVVAIEIDSRLKSALDNFSKRYSNVIIIIGNGLDKNLYENIFNEHNEEEWDIISNIPFHISEPLIKLLPKLPICKVRLLLGDNAARAVMATRDNDSFFSPMTVYARSFFDIDVGSQVPRTAFEPIPRTDAQIITLTKRTSLNLDDSIVREALNKDNTTITIKQAISAAMEHEKKRKVILKGKKIANRQDRHKINTLLRQFRNISPEMVHLGQMSEINTVVNVLKRLQIPTNLIHKPVNRYTTEEFRLVLRYMQLNW